MSVCERLEMNYLSYWSLLRKPFLTDDEASFFAGVPQREAIAGLNYFSTSPLNAAFLVAAPRCGMTWLLHRVKQMNGFGDCATDVVVTDGNQRHRDHVRAELSAAFGYHYAGDDTADQIGRAIEANSSQGIETIWLIDGAATSATRIARDLLVSHKHFSVVIGTAPQQVERLATQFGGEQLRIELAALSVQDTLHYVKHCLTHSGCNVPIIPDTTAVRLHEVTGGAVANLAHIAESSLALAANHQMAQVTPAVVEAIDQQFARAAA